MNSIDMTDPSSPTTEADQKYYQSHVEDSPHRHATLKKMDSFHRDTSRRSKTDTAGSRTSSPTSPHRDERRNDVTGNPLYCPIPTNADPTVVLAMRFQAWRSVVKEFINYFKSIASIEDSLSKNIAKLNNSLNVPFRENNADEFFIESGGVQDIGLAIKERAKVQAVTSNDNSRKILTNIIPPLEKLRSDLHLKIKEIKGLSGDFKNSVAKELDYTRRQLQVLSESLISASERPGEIAPKNDPHLVKMSFERQLRHHLQEENFLHQAHRNIESSGRALEGLVVKIIREAFTQYQEMLSAKATATSEFASRIRRTGVELPVDKEWDAFIADAKEMVDPSIPIRTFRDINYPGSNQVTLIRSGRLERKSKYLKSYSSAFYILTAVGYFHEFKSSHMQDLQVSLFLPSCTLGGHSSPNDKSHKFVLKGNQTGGMHRGHSWVFRAETHEEMLAWYDDIGQLVQLPHMSSSQRQTFIASHAPENAVERQRQSGSSSPGLDEDEADEVPYSQINSIEETDPQSHLRPTPGGSFPSETKLDAIAVVEGSRRYSRAGSDVTCELQPARISREEDGAVAAFFVSHELDRPYTGGTERSIGDEHFSTVAIGTSIGAVAAATAGGADMANKRKDDDIYQELDRGDGAPFTGPHVTTASYAATAITHGEPSQLESTDQKLGPFPPSLSTAANKIDTHPIDAAIGGVVGGVGGIIPSAPLRLQHHKSETSSANVTGEGIETKPPVDKDVLPAELNRLISSVPAANQTIRRSKSKREIVEETIAESMGNHPERGITPGAWPETPASEVQQQGIFS